MTPSTPIEGNRWILVPPPRFRWGARVVLPAALACAFLLLFIGSLRRTLVPVLLVDVIPVVQRASILSAENLDGPEEVPPVVQAAGWIEPDPFPTYATALTNGTVQEVLFLEGDSIQQGTVLARLIPDDAKIDLERATSELRAAQETWDENIAATLDLASASAAVRESRAQLDQARAEHQRAEALHKDAELLLWRVGQLLEEEVQTQQQYDTASAEAAAKAANVRMAKGRIVEAEATLARKQVEESAAKKRFELRTDDRRRLEEARIRVAEAELRMERMAIAAPIDGVVMERLVHNGSMLSAFSDNPEMARVASLYDPAHMQVRVDVPLADAAKVGRGQRALVTVEVFPDRVFEGEVSRITNRADIQKNTLEVKVALSRPSPLLKPDMLARVRFLAPADTSVGEPAEGLSVFAPATAIVGGLVWVVSGYDGVHGVAARRRVAHTGAEVQGWVEIETGLRPGDLLIAPAPPDLREGRRVVVRPPGGKPHGDD